MRNRLVVGALLATSVAACSDANLAEPEGLGLDAARYLNFALDLMQTHSIKRNEIDWTSFRAQTLDDAGNARTEADTHDAIRAAVERLGDKHSSFEAPSTVSLFTRSAPSPEVASPSGPALPALVDPTGTVVGTGTGYLDVPAFGLGGAEADAHASVYHAVIESVDTLSVCRWVVDLRGNTGGNMWPMLAGLGPVLGEGPYGFFVDPDSIVNEWYYSEGSAGYDDVPVVTATDPYELMGSQPPVAILTDSVTASAAEAIAVAFRERPETRSFGQATFGVPTAVAAYGLPDRAVLFLAVAWTADRAGTIYEEALEPDSMVAGDKTGAPATDAPLAAALSWLEAFPCN